MGRRGMKEYRAPEALMLIAADREAKPLVCPSCGSIEIVRIPERRGPNDPPVGRITLRCAACTRCAVYIQRVPQQHLEAPDRAS